MTQLLKNRFRGFLPIVIDVETAGFEAKTDALLELAAVSLCFSDTGLLVPDNSLHAHIIPFESARLDPKALEFTKIDPYHPFRFAESEAVAMEKLFRFVQEGLKNHGCQRAVLVGHNPSFDMAFLKAAIRRNQEKISKDPFHGFTTIDTASLSALAFGQTVLAKACKMAGIPFDINQAHSALYDAKRTAELFCHIVNLWKPHHARLIHKAHHRPRPGNTAVDSKAAPPAEAVMPPITKPPKPTPGEEKLGPEWNIGAPV